jgi:hypothetical protein
MSSWRARIPGLACLPAGQELSPSYRLPWTSSPGPLTGVVELPLDLAWSGDRGFDLADPVQRYLYHMTVLTSAVTREHYTSWLNASLLCSDWSKLRLPRLLREIWQAHFPELGPG